MLWQIYGWVFLALNVTWFVCLGLGSGTAVGINAIHWFDVPISLVALVGVLGYAYRRRLATRSFWWSWLLLTITWDVLGNFGLLDMWTDPHFDATAMEMLTWGVTKTALGLVLVLPAYIALVLYPLRWDALAVNAEASNA